MHMCPAEKVVDSLYPLRGLNGIWGHCTLNFWSGRRENIWATLSSNLLSPSRPQTSLSPRYPTSLSSRTSLTSPLCRNSIFQQHGREEAISTFTNRSGSKGDKENETVMKYAESQHHRGKVFASIGVFPTKSAQRYREVIIMTSSWLRMRFPDEMKHLTTDFWMHFYYNADLSCLTHQT